MQIARFGGPEVLDAVDLLDPCRARGEQLLGVCTAGGNYADTQPTRS